MKNKGFTLIEVVIAMAIMAFLTLMVNQSIKRGVDFKKKVQRNIDQRSAIDSAMRIIERDINLAFHYSDINTEVLKEVEKKKKEKTQNSGNAGNNANNGNAGNAGNSASNGNAGNAGNAGNNPPTDPNAPVYPNFKIRDIPNYTAFLGDRDSIHFTNLNNLSDQPDQLTGDQQEVGYFLKSCKKFDDESFKGQCLWRRTSTLVDDKVDEGGQENVLIAGVKKFELRYFGKQKEDWVGQWASDGKSDETLKDIFPQAVEVTLVIEDNKKELTAIRVIPLRFPNNREKPPDQKGGVTR